MNGTRPCCRRSTRAILAASAATTGRITPARRKRAARQTIRIRLKRQNRTSSPGGSCIPRPSDVYAPVSASLPSGGDRLQILEPVEDHLDVIHRAAQVLLL